MALAGCEGGISASGSSSFAAADLEAPAVNAMPVGITAFPPRGFAEFCDRHPGTCDQTSTAPAPIHLTAERWEQLTDVNSTVNRSFTFATGHEAWGNDYYWDYLRTKGDCKNFALEKQRRLEQLGWPAGSLLITIGDVPREGSHAVLTAVTDKGDYVLDILDGAVRPWQEVHYRWQKRQSAVNPQTWRRVTA